MTLQDFHQRLREAFPTCEYHLLWNGDRRYTPAHKSTWFGDSRFTTTYPEECTQRVSYGLYLTRDYFQKSCARLYLEASTLEGLLLEACTKGIQQAWTPDEEHVSKR